MSTTRKYVVTAISIVTTLAWLLTVRAAGDNHALGPLPAASEVRVVAEVLGSIPG